MENIRKFNRFTLLSKGDNIYDLEFNSKHLMLRTFYGIDFWTFTEFGNVGHLYTVPLHAIYNPTKIKFNATASTITTVTNNTEMFYMNLNT